MRGSSLPLAVLVLLGTLQLSPAQQAADEPSQVVNPNPLSGLDLESLTATRSLPLFTPSRTAPVVEAPIEAVIAPIEPQIEMEPERPPPALLLVGIVLTESSETALLLDPGSNEVHSLASGEEYDGWLLKIVDARSVEFRSGGRVQALKMFESFPAPPSFGAMPGGFPIDGVPPGFPSEGEPGAFPGGPSPDPPAPDAEFAPKLGDTPIPEEGAQPPGGRQP